MVVADLEQSITTITTIKTKRKFGFATDDVDKKVKPPPNSQNHPQSRADKTLSWRAYIENLQMVSPTNNRIVMEFDRLKVFLPMGFWKGHALFAFFGVIPGYTAFCVVMDLFWQYWTSPKKKDCKIASKKVKDILAVTWPVIAFYGFSLHWWISDRELAEPRMSTCMLLCPWFCMILATIAWVQDKVYLECGNDVAFALNKMYDHDELHHQQNELREDGNKREVVNAYLRDLKEVQIHTVGKKTWNLASESSLLQQIVQPPEGVPEIERHPWNYGWWLAGFDVVRSLQQSGSDQPKCPGSECASDYVPMEEQTIPKGRKFVHVHGNVFQAPDVDRLHLFGRGVVVFLLTVYPVAGWWYKVVEDEGGAEPFWYILFVWMLCVSIATWYALSWFAARMRRIQELQHALFQVLVHSAPGLATQEMLLVSHSALATAVTTESQIAKQPDVPDSDLDLHKFCSVFQFLGVIFCVERISIEFDLTTCTLMLILLISFWVPTNASLLACMSANNTSSYFDIKANSPEYERTMSQWGRFGCVHEAKTDTFIVLVVFFIVSYMLINLIFASIKLNKLLQTDLLSVLEGWKEKEKMRHQDYQAHLDRFKAVDTTVKLLGFGLTGSLQFKALGALSAVGTYFLPKLLRLLPGIFNSLQQMAVHGNLLLYAPAVPLIVIGCIALILRMQKS